MQNATKSFNTSGNLLESVKKLLSRHLCLIEREPVPASTVTLREIT